LLLCHVCHLLTEVVSIKATLKQHHSIIGMCKEWKATAKGSGEEDITDRKRLLPLKDARGRTEHNKTRLCTQPVVNVGAVKVCTGSRQVKVAHPDKGTKDVVDGTH